jgi:hypothetical protein
MDIGCMRRGLSGFSLYDDIYPLDSIVAVASEVPLLI